MTGEPVRPTAEDLHPLLEQMIAAAASAVGTRGPTLSAEAAATIERVWPVVAAQAQRDAEAVARLRDSEDALARAADIANSWAREASTPEAKRLHELPHVIDCLWARLSREANIARQKLAAAERRGRRLEAQLRSIIPAGHERCEPAECNFRRALDLLAPPAADAPTS